MLSLSELLKDQNSGAWVVAVDRPRQMELAEEVYWRVNRPDTRLRFVLHVMEDLPRLPFDSELTAFQADYLAWCLERVKEEDSSPNGPLELWQVHTESCGLGE